MARRDGNPLHYEVIHDIGESANKCTIAPLEGRPDFKLIRVTRAPTLGPLGADLLLHPDGSCITSLRRELPGPVRGIAAVDCVWRRLPILLRRIQGTLPPRARIPDGFVTAYPRRSEGETDPLAGLATIEAIFVAAALLGHWDSTLLEKYYFGRTFVELNREQFLELGVAEAADPARWPVYLAPARNSAQRRRDRIWAHRS